MSVAKNALILNTEVKPNEDIFDASVSFTNIDVVPYKVILNSKLTQSIIKKKKVIPIHVQICPTNRCNLDCPFCSCARRNEQEELKLEELKEIVDICLALGTQAITLAGGGEPLLHPDINEFLEYCSERKIPVGLVTNGNLLERLKQKASKAIRWCRISYGDGRNDWDKFKDTVTNTVARFPQIDWGLSYIVTENPNLIAQINVVELANRLMFTHIRFSPDLYNPEKVDLNEIRTILSALSIDTRLVHYHYKQEISKGNRECRSSLLKPMISADGNIYPCGGIQYETNNTREFKKDKAMGTYRNLSTLIDNQSFFNGSDCTRCYFNNYNSLLKVMVDGLIHPEWV